MKGQTPELPAAPAAAPEREASAETVVHGVGVAPGIAIGPPYLYAKQALTAKRRRLGLHEVEAEIRRFEEAVERSERDLHKIAALTREKIGEGSAEIFEAQALMLRDMALFDAVILRIREYRVNADFAVTTEIEKARRMLEANSNAFFRERVNDLLDVRNRIIRHLQRGEILSKIDENRIVVAENLSAADIILFSRRHALGCALDFGGPTSHVSIMARALGVPAVVSLHGVSSTIRQDDELILDGFSGTVIVNPDADTVARYRRKQQRYQRLLQEQQQLVPLPAETLDGHRVRLRANAEFKQELPLLARFGAEGIGLFRTEMLFLTYGRSLSEEEQFATYREIVEAVRPEPTTFRLIDLGGDKLLPLAHREHNPFLGWRGIRILLDKPELLRPQLRAILRASAFGPVRILIPMVTALEEVHQVKEMIAEVRAELRAENAPFDERVPVGIMVEVPAVALMARHFAAETDFFSIGTNDLTQYVLAVDRGNDLVSSLYNELHPALLNLIAAIITAAHQQGIPVSLCGEMAANPRVVPLFVGMGLDEFSASPAYLPEIKRVIRALAREEAAAFTRTVLAQPDASSVSRLLEAWLHEHTRELAQFHNDLSNGTEATRR